LVVHEATRLSQEVIVRVEGDTKFYMPVPVVQDATRLQRKVKSHPGGRRKLRVPVPELV
jgi:hypothetical protein